jgi:DNA-binding PadR family transcriptional regulator
MAVLGLLARHGPQHGYQLRKLIERQNIDRFSNVQLGSIYASLKRLTCDGLVAVRSTELGGRGPARAVHAITKDGRRELERLIARSFVSVEQPERPVDLALHLSSLLAQEAVISLLEERRDALKKHQRGVERLVASTEHPQEAVRDLIRDIGEHFLAMDRADQEWTERVLRNVRRGRYRVDPSSAGE